MKEKFVIINEKGYKLVDAKKYIEDCINAKRSKIIEPPKSVKEPINTDNIEGVYKDWSGYEKQLNNIEKPIVLEGFIGAICDNELYVNCGRDDMIRWKVKDSETAWEFYCKEVKITIEIKEKK